MTKIYNDKIEKLDLGEFGQHIDEYSCSLENAFCSIAEGNVGIYYSELFGWAADHIDDSDEEIACGVPHLADEIDTLLHHSAHLYHIFAVDLYAVLAEDGKEHIGHFLVAAHLHILVVEPFGFLNVELGTALADMGDVEHLDEFVHG